MHFHPLDKYRQLSDPWVLPVLFCHFLSFLLFLLTGYIHLFLFLHSLPFALHSFHRCHSFLLPFYDIHTCIYPHILSVLLSEYVFLFFHPNRWICNDARHNSCNRNASHCLRRCYSNLCHIFIFSF